MSPSQLPEYYIGLMSGTSLDGIDAALVDFAGERPLLVATHYQAYDPVLRATLKALCYAESVNLKMLGELDSQLGLLFGECVALLLAKADVARDHVLAIGSHGQTVFHHPEGRHAFSWQIADPNRIVQATGITTVADFRRRDIAAGGQGAPLVPAFHQALFQSPEEYRVVVNLGGIANLTVLPEIDGGAVFGFDSGPGNTLMDSWINEHLDTRHDENGAWARSGRMDQPLLRAMLGDPYFEKTPPKSTGQEYFSRAWLAKHLESTNAAAEDIQATLCQLTATSVISAIRQYAPRTARILLCGGGIHNGYLRECIQNGAACAVESTESFGVHPDWVEAMAFAWLARQTLKGLPGNLPAVTGANTPVSLGGIYRP